MLSIMKNKWFLGIGLGVIILSATGITLGIIYANPNSNGGYAEDIEVTFINHATVMIEFENTRIYIDPYELETYSDCLPADYIFITHNHGDHYSPADIDLIIQNTTTIIAPLFCGDITGAYDVFTVRPGNIYAIDNITVETFPMDTYISNHARELEYCGYLVTIGDQSIYHAGDTRIIPEFSQLEGRVDVACLPVGGECSAMGEMEASEAVGVIKPHYVIPIHFNLDFIDLDYFADLCEGEYSDAIVWSGTNPLILT